MGGLGRKYKIPESWTQLKVSAEVMQNENLATLPVSVISHIYLKIHCPFRLISYGLSRTPDLRSNLSMW